MIGYGVSNDRTRDGRRVEGEKFSFTDVDIPIEGGYCRDAERREAEEEALHSCRTVKLSMFDPPRRHAVGVFIRAIGEEGGKIKWNEVLEIK